VIGRGNGRVGSALGLALLLLALSTCPDAGARTGERTIELPRGRIYRLLPSAMPVALTIPLRLRANIKLSNLRAVVVGTARDTHADDALDDTFLVGFRRGPRRAPLLTLRAANPRTLEQGTYVLQLSVYSTRGPLVTQRIPLTVVVPAAVLRQPQPQVVTSTVWFPWNDVHARRKLALQEIGRRSWVADVVTVDGDTGRATDELVEVGGVNSVPRSGVTLGYVSFTGDYPMGDTRGSFELGASQLAAPMTVTYTLTKRLQPAWIVVLALIGALLGTLTRVTVVEYSARRKARDEAMARLAELREAIERTADQQLRRALEQQSGKLARGLAVEHDGETLLRTIADVEAELRLAREDHQTRSEHARAQLSEWRRVLKDERDVPEAIIRRLDDARRCRDAATQALDDHEDVATASRALGELAELLNPGDLRAAAAQWRDETRDFARWTERRLSLLPPEIDSRELITRREALIAALDDQLVWTAPHTTTQEILNALPKVGPLRRDLAEQASEDVKAALDAAAEEAGAGAAKRRLAERSAAIDEALAAWLATRRIDASLDELERALDAGIAAVRRTRGTPAAGRAASRPAAVAPIVLAPAAAASTGASAAPAASPLVPPAPWGKTSWIPKAWAWLKKAARKVRRRGTDAFMWSVRACSTMILVAIAALVLFRGTWVGTFDQIVAVFLWGYGLNLSATTLFDIATRSPRASSGAV